MVAQRSIRHRGGDQVGPGDVSQEVGEAALLVEQDLAEDPVLVHDAGVRVDLVDAGQQRHSPPQAGRDIHRPLHRAAARLVAHLQRLAQHPARRDPPGSLGAEGEDLREVTDPPGAPEGLAVGPLGEQGHRVERAGGVTARLCRVGCGHRRQPGAHVRERVLRRAARAAGRRTTWAALA